MRLYTLYTMAAAVFAAPGYLIPRDKQLFAILDLPGLMENIPADQQPIMYAGLVDVGDDSKYFYWKVEDKTKLPENVNRTMFWLNGGPGCSLMDGALLESGPFRINDDLQVTYNNGSWHKLMDMVFVDQPVGTGFSDVDSEKYASQLPEVGATFLKFLQLYFAEFPEDRDNEIYFGGELYAGQYIPFILKAIIDENNKLDHRYNIAGAAIGNGWISPNEQLLWYIPFMKQAGLLEGINFDSLLNKQEQCQKRVDDIDLKWDQPEVNPQEVDSSYCESILNDLLLLTRNGNGNDACINYYDYTLRDSYPACGLNWPYELKYVTPFLQQDSVRESLHVTESRQWRECKGMVGRRLRADADKPAVHLLPEIAAHVPLVLFNGNLDIICNYLGQELYLNKLEWGGKRGFDDDAHLDWFHDLKLAGYIKLSRNISSLVVFNASHMVPYDQPEVSRSIIDVLVGNYDVKDKKMETFPIGERQAKLEEGKGKLSSDVKLTDEKTGEQNKSGQEPEKTPEEIPQQPEKKPEETPEDDDASGQVLLWTRAIEVTVVVVLIWGVYVLFASYRSRPQSIIRQLGLSQLGKRKNVQWADQLRQFQADDDDNDDDDDFDSQLGSLSQHQGQGLLAKAIDKLTPGGNKQYTAVPTDLELGKDTTPASDHDFVIDDEDDDELPLKST